MDIDGLRAFLAVLEEGQFGAAADRLRVSQPTLSRRVQRLELQAGARLLARGVRPVVGTEAGVLLTRYARSIVDAADAAVGQLQRLAAGEIRTARVGYVQSATFGWVGALAAAASAGGLDLELVAAPGIRQLDAIRSGRLDAGVIRLESVDHDLTGLIHHELSRDPLHAVLSEDHPLAADQTNPAPRGRQVHLPVTPGDLRNERLVLYPESEGPGLRRLIRGWLETGTVRSTDAWDAASAAALAAAGVGVAILPGPLPPLPPKALVRPLANSPRLALALVWHPQRDIAVRRLLDHLPAPGG